jgi:transposase-like protein
MATVTTTREERGQTIAHRNGQVKRIDETFYTVKSQNGNGEYAVTKVDHEWICECPDNKYRHVECKHIYATKFSQSLRAEVAVRRITPIENLSNCIYCGSSNLKKKGIRKNKSGNIQKFYCRDCHRYFTFNIGFERMKHNPQAITSAMQLYFSGESLRNTMKSLRLLGVEVSYRTILNWIKKYVKLMQNYTESIIPNVSDTWRADEIYIKVKGDMKYLFAMMDDETRFWIAQEVAETKYTHDARTLFRMSKQLMGKKPMTLITDGLPAYHDAYLKEYWTLKKETRTEHIRHITIRGDHNNNKMERMNGEVRDREKVMRGLKKTDSPILSGYQLFHNYIRPHEGLKGKTPSEACGIKIEGENKWITLIQNASQQTKSNTLNNSTKS